MNTKKIFTFNLSVCFFFMIFFLSFGINTIAQNTEKALSVSGSTSSTSSDSLIFKSGSSFGGFVNRAALQNNYAFLIQGKNLNVRDLSNGNKFLSSISFSYQPENGIIVNDYMYLNYSMWDSYNNNIEIANISDKNHITKSATFHDSRILDEGIETMTYCQTGAGKTLLFVLTSGNAVDDKILMYDVTSPASPVYVSEVSSSYGISEISGSGDYLYALVGGKLTVYDISANTFDTKGSLTISFPVNIAVSGNYVYVACQLSHGLKIIDVSDPTAPTEAASFGDGTYSFYNNILVAENKVFLETIKDEIVAVAVSDSLTTTELSKYNPTELGSSFKFSGYYQNSLFLNYSGHFYKIDYSDPSSPSVSLAINEPAIVDGNVALGDSLYTIADGKLWFYSVDTLGNAFLNSTTDISKANKIFTYGQYLFIGDYTKLLYIYNRSLQLLGTYDAGAEIMDLKAKNNLLYMVLFDTTMCKIVDCNNPSAPVDESSFQLPNHGQAIAISADGNTAYTASNQNVGTENEQGYFQVIDVSNPSKPVLKSSKMISAGNSIYNLVVRDSSLFAGVSSGIDSKIEAWDVSNPSAPSLIGTSPLINSNLKDLKYYDGYFFAALQDAGQIVTYTWDATEKKFTAGTTIASSSPCEINFSSGTQHTALSKIGSQASKIENSNTTTDNMVAINGYKHTEYPTPEGGGGNKLIKIIKKPKQHKKATLTLGGGTGSQHFCTSDTSEMKSVGILRITLKADDVSDWIVHSVTFTSFGSGDELNDIDTVRLYKTSVNGRLFDIKKFSADDGKITLSTGSYEILAGGWISLVVVYTYKDTLNIKPGAIKDFNLKINSSAVSAEPASANVNGVILPNPKQYMTGGPVVFAPVWETIEQKPYEHIQDAIDDAGEDGADIFVCPGEYEEQITIDKPDISLDGCLQNPEKVIVNGGESWVLEVDGADENQVVEGFTFRGKSTPSHNAIDFIESAKFIFEDNITFVDKINTSGHYINDNLNIVDNKFYDLDSLVMNKAQGYHVSHNEFTGHTYLIINGKPWGANTINDNSLIGGIVIKNSGLNEITKNKISYSKTNGILIEANMGYNTADNNVIQGNEIHLNNLNGILLKSASKTTIYNNKIHNNAKEGLYIEFSDLTNVAYNDIYQNTYNGIVLDDRSADTKINNNTIRDHQIVYVNGVNAYHPSGVYLKNVLNTSINSNKIVNNCSGINDYSSEKTSIGLNFITNATCTNTGIHLVNSSPKIKGNTIANNAGNGIYAEKGSNPAIRSNNISGNSAFGVNNADQSVTIDANGNYWGDANGPGSSGATGNVDANSWLSKEVSLVSATGVDTLHTTAGKEDSVTVLFQNFKYPNDMLDITVSEQQNWITGPTTFTSQMQDSVGTHANIIFNIPGGATEKAIDKITIKAKSHTETTTSVRDSFYVSVYQPALYEVNVSPDTAQIALGDSVQFYASGYDQFSNLFDINPLWQTTIGEITSNGLFKSPTKGTGAVTATDSATGIQGSAVVIVGNAVGVEEEKAPPKALVLSQNYPNPFNSTTIIKYQLPKSTEVSLKIYNLSGQVVRTLVDERQISGNYSITWDGRNNNGQFVTSGTYFYKLRTKNFIKMKMMILIR